VSGRHQRGASSTSVLLGGLAALLALGIVVGGGYMLVTTAGAPPPARPSAKPAPPPEPVVPPVDDEVKEYVARVDAVMQGRETVLKALNDVVLLEGNREMDIDAAMQITVRRRTVSQDALDEFLKIEPPGQAARIHDLYRKLLNEDISMTDQTVAALRAGDGNKAVQLSQARDARVKETLALIRETAKVLGVK
jgi:hypothetical protein